MVELSPFLWQGLAAHAAGARSGTHHRVQHRRGETGHSRPCPAPSEARPRSGQFESTSRRGTPTPKPASPGPAERAGSQPGLDLPLALPGVDREHPPHRGTAPASVPAGLARSTPMPKMSRVKDTPWPASPATTRTSHAERLARARRARRPARTSAWRPAGSSASPGTLVPAAPRQEGAKCVASWWSLGVSLVAPPAHGGLDDRRPMRRAKPCRELVRPGAKIMPSLPITGGRPQAPRPRGPMPGPWPPRPTQTPARSAPHCVS